MMCLCACKEKGLIPRILCPKIPARRLCLSAKTRRRLSLINYGGIGHDFYRSVIASRHNVLPMLLILTTASLSEAAEILVCETHTPYSEYGVCSGYWLFLLVASRPNERGLPGAKARTPTQGGRSFVMLILFSRKEVKLDESLGDRRDS
ncbi:predicted protein [Coccidioides posadasii str. Silveira]|uniref:Predicted protein n=2 Tax=Coccidioides posadasii TaxID=199306 RepID=E9D9W2_COCPS|nr:predicted protein [Coccidioides posadasii str. Silveira]KMM64542.1 hypothetical protein CPAG_00894 [Coccidioides posadasii RMSCC 3488]